jgi:hypothetical protein
VPVQALDDSLQVSVDSVDTTTSLKRPSLRFSSIAALSSGSLHLGDDPRIRPPFLGPDEGSSEFVVGQAGELRGIREDLPDLHVLDEDDLLLERQAPLRTKADVDLEIGDLPRQRRLGMAARRAADVFSWARMPATASLLRELAYELDLPSRIAEDFLKPEQ